MDNFAVKKIDFNMGLPVINDHTAGIDTVYFVRSTSIGSMLMTVSYTGKDGCTYLFECDSFTVDLKRLVKILSDEEITDVVMEATGVYRVLRTQYKYWMSLYELLEDASIKVTLINPAHFKNVAAQKTDACTLRSTRVNDSLWLNQLHACGLLRNSHIASDHFRELRHYIHERGVIQQQKSDTLNRIHRQLTLMNIKFQHLISDIEGVGGMKILRAIASGIPCTSYAVQVSDPVQLLSLLDLKLFKASPEELLKSLQGIYTCTTYKVRSKEQFLNLLKMKVKEYDFYKEQMLEYDRLIEGVLKKIVVSVPESALKIQKAQAVAEKKSPNTTEKTNILLM